MRRRPRSSISIALRFGDAAVPFLMKLLDDDAMSTGASRMHLGRAAVDRAAAPRLVARRSARRRRSPGPIIACLGEIGDEAAVQPVSRYLSSGRPLRDRGARARAHRRTVAPNGSSTACWRSSNATHASRRASSCSSGSDPKEFLEEDTERAADDKGRYSRE